MCSARQVRCEATLARRSRSARPVPHRRPPVAVAQSALRGADCTGPLARAAAVDGDAAREGEAMTYTDIAETKAREIAKLVQREGATPAVFAVIQAELCIAWERGYQGGLSEANQVWTDATVGLLGRRTKP